MPAPAAAGLLARLLPAITRMVGGGAGAARGAKAAGAAQSIPMGVRVPQGMEGKLGTPQRISAADLADGKQEEAEAARQAASGTKDFVKALALGPPAIGLAVMALKGFSNRLLEGQRVFAQYNGQTASAFAQLDVNRIQRDIRQGNANAGSTEGLARALDSLEEALLPLETVITELLNRGAVVLIELIKPLIDSAVAVAKGLDGVAEMFGGDVIDDQVWKDIENAKRQRDLGMPGALAGFLGGLQGGVGGFGEPPGVAEFRRRMAQGGYSYSQRVQAEARRNNEWARNRHAERAAKRRASTEATKQRRRAENEARRAAKEGKNAVDGGGAFPVLEGET
jgi:hypothetical protein